MVVFRVRFLRLFEKRLLRPFKWSKAGTPTYKYFDVQGVATKSYGSPLFRFLLRRNLTLNTPGICSGYPMEPMKLMFVESGSDGAEVRSPAYSVCFDMWSIILSIYFIGW